MTGKLCSNDAEVVCTKDNECAFGPCQDGVCKDNPEMTCSTNADCDGTCGGNHVSMSGLGWLNWTLQKDKIGAHSCQDVGEPGDCSSECTGYNLRPGTCLSGQIGVGEWIAGGAGVQNDVCIRKLLKCYAGLPLDEGGCPSVTCENPGEEITLPVYDVVRGTGCNQGQLESGKMEYRVLGFVRFKILGYMLAQGSGNAAGHDGEGCVDWGGSGNRITGEFMGWYDGTAGDCNPYGSLTGASMIK
jgi:hypothetical protein